MNNPQTLEDICGVFLIIIAILFGVPLLLCVEGWVFMALWHLTPLSHYWAPSFGEAVAVVLVAVFFLDGTKCKNEDISLWKEILLPPLSAIIFLAVAGVLFGVIGIQ